MKQPCNKILILDDHILFGEGLKLLLCNNFGAEVTVEHDIESLLANISDLNQYSLIIIDLHMPEIDGFSVLKAIRNQELNVNVVAVSSSEDQKEIEKAISLGVNGYIPKNSKTDEMLKGIETVLNGQRYLPPDWDGQINWLPQAAQDTKQLGKIGPRQIEVLNMMRDGLRNKQIALILGVSESAVKSHVEILFRELRVSNRTACVGAGIRDGLINAS